MAKKESSPEAYARRPYTRRDAPFVCEAASGEHWWCACGKSERQPFCDGSHRGGPHGPLVVRTGGGVAAWCGCKRTATPPYCDGSHARPAGDPR